MNNIEKYFAGERLQCTLGIIVAIIFISLSAYFLFLQKPLLRGMSYSFIPLSVLLFAICLGVVIRTPKDIDRVTTLYNTEPQKMQTTELVRMEKVMKSFTVIKMVEIIFLVVGLVLMMFFWKNDLMKGIALGLMILSAVLYLFDFIAAERGKLYVEILKSLG